MAPELALHSMRSLRPGSIVLDPMAGSGTVLRHALSLGHQAIGFDMDPLAVLMSRVWTSDTDLVEAEVELHVLIEESRQIDLRRERMAWVSGSAETRAFMKYWFAPAQRRAMTRLAIALHRRRLANPTGRDAQTFDILQLALSRIVVTKEAGASLARDTSHSRPHRVALESDYDVELGFERSARQILSRLAESKIKTSAVVRIGDARKLDLRANSIDAIVTSPPYLNAIDYMRGHRIALVWLGFTLEELRSIRSNSIGAERAAQVVVDDVARVAQAMHAGQDLPKRIEAMVLRYAGDLLHVTSQASRVLRRSGRATFVVGNSCLRGCDLDNALGLRTAAETWGLRLEELVERALPTGSRYLPITGRDLSKRMRTETVLTFVN